MNGIDISNYQRKMDITKVDFDFVIIKATEGVRYIDPSCDRFYQQAKKMEKLLGVYHYANGGNVIQEVDFFLKHIAGYLNEAALFLDWERANNPSFGRNDRAWCKAFLDEVYRRTGIRPLLYVQRSALTRVQNLGDYGTWVAEYASNGVINGYQEHPWHEGQYGCCIRQYSGNGRLSGYSGALDLDKAYMTPEAWKKYAGTVEGGTQPDPVPQTSPHPPAGSTLELVYQTMKGQYGEGGARKQVLGSRYSEVQEFINHIYSASPKELAEEIWSGKYGSGEIRKTVLGSRYQEAQEAVNSLSKPAKYYTVQSGDTLSSIAARFGKNWKELQRINGIQNPNRIYKGQKLRIE